MTASVKTTQQQTIERRLPSLEHAVRYGFQHQQGQGQEVRDQVQELAHNVQQLAHNVEDRFDTVHKELKALRRGITALLNRSV